MCFHAQVILWYWKTRDKCHENEEKSVIKCLLFSFMPWALVSRLMRWWDAVCTFSFVCSLHRCHPLILSATSSHFSGVIVSVGGGGGGAGGVGGIWNSVLCLLSSAGSPPLKMSEEVTEANEMNFGLFCSYLCKTRLSQKMKRDAVFLFS